MPELGKFARELRGRLWKPAVEAEVNDEMMHHLEMLEADLIERGVEPSDAQRLALEKFGDVARLGAECRDLGEQRDQERRRAEWLGELAHDARFALRQLRVKLRFAIVAIVTLAIGLGASTTIFGVASAVLLRPLPFPDSDRLLIAYELSPTRQDWSISEPNFVDWQSSTSRFESLAAFSGRTPGITGGDAPEELRGSAVTHSFFPTLGIPPALGRVFRAEEDVAGSPARVAVLSHALWTRRFGADTSVLGEIVDLDGVAHQVIGVMPRGFDFPGEVDVWIPLGPDRADNRGDRRLIAVGRLADGSSAEAADAELRGIAANLAREHPVANADWSARVQPIDEWFVTPQLRARVLALLLAVGLLLGLACVNVASLLLARAGAREREMALRAALGAGRGRIVRQLLTESVVLAALGTVTGIALAAAAVPIIRSAGAAAVPQLAELALDWRVLTFAAAACVITGLVFGLAPALRLARTGGGGGGGHEPLEVLRGGTRVAAAGRLRGTLIVSSVALAMLLLVCAGLVAGSFRRLMQVDIGFTTERVLTASIALPSDPYDEARRVIFHAELASRLEALPSVVAAGATNIAPFSEGNTGMGWEVTERADGFVGDYRNAHWRAVTPGYFASLGIPLTRGRLLGAEDRWDAPDVVVVNEALARSGWPDTDPVGDRITLSNGRTHTIVGVVGDTRHLALDSVPAPAVYFPHSQFPWRDMWITVRTTGDPLEIAAAVRREVAEMDPGVPVSQLQPLTQLVADVSAEPRLTMLILGIFALAALALAAVGLYGIVSFTVVQRTRELGVRLALGAPPRRVLGLVLGQGMGLTIAGIAVGALAAYGVTRFLASILFETEPMDVMTLVAVAALLLLVSAIASVIPARRAARLDPAAALRAE